MARLPLFSPDVITITNGQSVKPPEGCSWAGTFELSFGQDKHTVHVSFPREYRQVSDPRSPADIPLADWGEATISRLRGLIPNSDVPYPERADEFWEQAKKIDAVTILNLP